MTFVARFISWSEFGKVVWDNSILIVYKTLFNKIKIRRGNRANPYSLDVSVIP
jgi:hypothetical protein